MLNVLLTGVVELQTEWHGKATFYCKVGLRNLWHACPKWHAKIRSWHAAVTLDSSYILPDNVAVLWRYTRIYIDIYIYLSITLRKN